MMYELMRKRLFAMDPEDAHDRVLGLLARTQSSRLGLRMLRGLFGRHCPTTEPILEFRTCGGTTAHQRFPSRMGLAAGMDKNAAALDAWAALGFGFVEVGTVTPEPQPGNPRPRLFRLENEHAIVNRMGFNSAGGAEVYANLAKSRTFWHPTIVSVGPNRERVAPDQWRGDMAQLIPALHSQRRLMFCLNVSSPNTPGLRGLQSALDTLAGLYDDLGEAAPGAIVGLKLSPDMTDEQTARCFEFTRHALVGFVTLANTSVNHPFGFAGGYSGPQLFNENALNRVRLASTMLPVNTPIIAVGGIQDAETAMMYRQYGADLLQIYTGLVYRGPALIREIATALAEERAP